MASVNKAILIGYVGADIDMRQGANGIPITNISFYTQRHFKNAEGETETETDCIPIHSGCSLKFRCRR